MTTPRGVFTRDQRLLKPARGCHVPAAWLFVDTETTAREVGGYVVHYFRLGWVCSVVRDNGGGEGTRDWRFFLDAGKMHSFLEEFVSGFGEVVLLGHNVFFDLQASGFYPWFSRAGWKLDFYYSNALTYILTCRKGSLLLRVLSTTNWFDCSLGDLGRLVGLEKMAVNFESDDVPTLKRYCKRDVEIIVRAMDYYVDFITTNNLGRFSLTRASQAFNAFRYRFMTTRVYLHDDPAVVSLERDAYMGGRVEAFHLGQVPGEGFVSLDVNGMYPHVMSNNVYPTRLVDHLVDPPVGKIMDVVKKYGVIARVDVDTPVNAYALRERFKTIYPVGQFTTTLCTRGLSRALGEGHVTRVHEAAVYKMGDIFSGYVRYFHELRVSYQDEGNVVMARLCKYMENSLYGKFGQKGIVSEVTPAGDPGVYSREEIVDRVRGGVVIVTTFMNSKVVQFESGLNEKAFVAVAAHVTEDARLLLWDIMSTTGLDRVLYCDTDSIKIRRRDMHLVRWPVHPTDLGALKVEDVTRELYIEGAKNYRTEKGRHVKGIPAGAVEFSPGWFIYDSFEGQVAHLRRGVSEGNVVTRVTRHLDHYYDKGVVNDDHTVSPFVMTLGSRLDEPPRLPF